jgi:hypothetical protein
LKERPLSGTPCAAQNVTDGRRAVGTVRLYVLFWDHPIGGLATELRRMRSFRSHSERGRKILPLGNRLSFLGLGVQPPMTP